jgi:glucose-1-phosphate thymidylyltransferase
MRSPIVGIVPAAGKATRLGPGRCAKELLPVGETTAPFPIRPKAISEYLIDGLAGAGADRVCVVIAPDKQDIVRFYGSGEAHGVPIAYVCQESPTGMADAIDLAFPWIRDATVLLGMPDTVFRPADALAQLWAFYEATPTDIALAIGPTDDPARLGPVVFDASGRVLEVLDKPETPPHNKVWMVACWNARFTEFLHAYLREPRGPAGREVALGWIFQAALEQGFRVRALPFDDGVYIDAGTIEGLRAAERLVRAPSPVASLR